MIEEWFCSLLIMQVTPEVHYTNQMADMSINLA